MARTGIRRRSKDELRRLAYIEYYAAIDEFAHAMGHAEVDYIAKTLASYPMTMNMSGAFARYVEACRRIRELNG